MHGDADCWPYQAEIEIAREGFDAKLRAAEAWLKEWEISYRIGSSLAGASGNLRVCFAEAKFASAFIAHHGGRQVPADEIAAALAADADDDALYDRLASGHDG